MKRIYLITPNILTKKFYSFLPKVLASKKVKFLQLRCKSYSRSKIDIHLRKILTITKKHKVKLIINDDSSFVKKYKNTSFHLGQKDLMKKDNISNLNKFKKRLDPRLYNGAIFIGLDSPVVKSHGGTDFIGFSNSLSVCNRIIKGNLIDKIKNNIL